MCMSVLIPCIQVHHIQQGPEEGFELLYGCWEQNQDSLQEQQVVLTVSHHSSSSLYAF